MIDVLFEDNHLLVVNKPAGQLVQPDPSGAPGSVEDEAKAYLRQKYQKPGEAFLGVVHRIDRRVSGVVVLAKTSKALSRLNEQLRDGGFEKTYLAVVEAAPPKEKDRLVHYLTRDPRTNKSYVSVGEKPGAKRAELEYELVGRSERYWLVRVRLLTGRHHQIRAQLASIGCPIKGDVKYGARRTNADGSICLHSHTLGLRHPVGSAPMRFEAPLPVAEPWTALAAQR